MTTKLAMTLKSANHLRFEELTFSYMKQLFRLAYARVGNSDDAEDIVQDTYLKAFRSFDTFRQESAVGTWLVRILLNTANDHLRKVSRGLPCAVPLQELEELSQPGPEEEICKNEIDPELMEALKRLPEAFLTPLILREIYEASYEEIAQILDLPAGTVMSRLHRGKAMLRRSLQDLQKERLEQGRLPSARRSMR